MEEDLFGSLIKLCKPTTSQELKFLNCPFARESEPFQENESETGGTSEELTGIVMVSLSDSSKEDCCEVAERAVDLGKDSDNLGFSEPKQSEVFENKSKRFGDSESESSGSLLKKSRVLHVNLGSEAPNVDVVETEIIESELEGNGEGLCDSLAQTTELLIENTVTVNIDTPRVETDDVTGGERERVEFVSSGGGVWMREDVGNSPAKKKDLIDALKRIAEEIDDGDEESEDFLETAKKRGMNFPWPRWWPPEGFDGH